MALKIRNSTEKMAVFMIFTLVSPSEWYNKNLHGGGINIGPHKAILISVKCYRLGKDFNPSPSTILSYLRNQYKGQLF